MSEPVSTAEIEDVLSSIRRLVSNDVEAAKENANSEAAEAAPAGKLILTADFRVAESRDKAPDDTAEEDAQADAAGVAEDTEQNTSEDSPLEFHHNEPVSQADAEFEAHVDAQVDMEPVSEGVSSEVFSDVVEDGKTSQLEDTIAELEAAIGQQDGDWEPDGSDFEEDADAEEMMSEPVQDWIDGTAQEVEEMPVEAETETDTVADSATEATADKGDRDLFGDDDAVIDEETLRDMVSDIVRQELQGALGERITRNVRKLVRREINRVLASQEFD